MTRRVPQLILTEEDLETAVLNLMDFTEFVIDIETTMGGSHSNSLLWIGLGGQPGHIYLIPVAHPKGIQLVPSHKEKTAAFILYGADDPRSVTKMGKPSMRMVEHTVSAIFARAPQQLTPSRALEIIKPLLFSKRRKIGHNLKFDLGSLEKYYGCTVPGPYCDMILVRHLLDEELPDYGLKPLTCDWFRIPYPEREKFYPTIGKQGVENFGLDVVARYLAKDVRYEWMMYRKWFPRLKANGLLDAFKIEEAVYPAVMTMELAGFAVDTNKTAEVRAALEQQIHEIEETCWRIAGDQFKLSNDSAKRWLMFGQGDPYIGESGRKLNTLQLKVRSRTAKTKVAQVDKATMEFYAERGVELAEQLLEWSKANKLYGTFVKDLSAYMSFPEDDRPRVHTSYKQHGTVTGRFSSSEPNLQQIPRGSRIKDLFVAGKGCLLIDADYSQVELRVAAYLSGDKHMTRILMEGGDMHSEASSAMLRKPIELVTEEERNIGKTQNFLVIYGGGAKRLMRVAHCSETEAQIFIDRYYANFPEIEPWKERELKLARKLGDRGSPTVRPPYVSIPPFGRRRRLPDLYHPDQYVRWGAERQAINAIVQGMAAYVTKLALVDLYNEFAGMPIRLIAQVHDEIVLEVPEDRAEKIMSTVVEIMQDVRNPEGLPIIGKIPLLADAHIGATWAEAKSGTWVAA